MAWFHFGKKKEENKKTPACACSCSCPANEAEEITKDGCTEKKEAGCCIKVLGAGCKFDRISFLRYDTHTFIL